MLSDTIHLSTGWVAFTKKMGGTFKYQNVKQRVTKMGMWSPYLKINDHNLYSTEPLFRSVYRCHLLTISKHDFHYLNVPRILDFRMAACGLHRCSQAHLCVYMCCAYIVLFIWRKKSIDAVRFFFRLISFVALLSTFILFDHPCFF